MPDSTAVILYSTTLHAWEVWRNGRPEGHGSLASCRAHAPEPSADQHRLAAEDVPVGAAQ